MKRFLHCILAVCMAFGLAFTPVLAQAPEGVLPTQPRTVDIFNPGQSTDAGATNPNVTEPVNLIEVGPARVMAFIFSLFTLVSIVVAIYAGATVIFSGGDQKKVETGVRALIYAAAGMLIVGAAWLLVRVVLNIDVTRVW